MYVSFQWRFVEWIVDGKVRLRALDANLVESVRTPAGPRQRHVAYLGRVLEPRITGTGWKDRQERARFWHGVARRLDALGGNRMTPDQRAKIEAKLAERVPREDPVYWTERWRYEAEAMSEWGREAIARMHGETPSHR